MAENVTVPLRWTFERFDPDSADAKAAWRELSSVMGASPVTMPEFVFSCARTLSPGPLRFAICTRGERVVAAAILRRFGGPYPEVFVESQMPVGAWVQLPSEDLVELTQSLMIASGLTLRLGLSQVDPRFVPRPLEGLQTHTLDYIETAWVEFQGTFDDYWAARGKNLRTNMRRQRDKLAAQGVTTRMEVLDRPEDMQRGVAEYAALESRGWKAELGTAVSEDHPQTVFYREMLAAFARLGQARIYRYFFDDRLVATEFCLVSGEEMVILKTTHDESVHPFSPASLLRQEMFAGLFEEGVVRRLEFYGPLKEWHTRWTELVRTIYHANVYRFSTVRHLERIVRAGLARAHPEPASAAKAPLRWHEQPLEMLSGDGAEVWNRLNAEHCGGHPVFDARLVLTALNGFPRRDVRLMVLGDSRNPRGALLLEWVAPGVWRNFQRSQMQISSVLLAERDFAHLSGVFECLAPATLAIEFLNQDSAYVRWPAAMLPSATAVVLDAGKTGTISLEGAFHEYWSARPRKLQHDMAIYERRLAAQGTPVSLRVVEDVEGVIGAVREFGLMESRGWKASGGTAVHPDNAQGRYYREVFGLFGEHGEATAYELVAGNVVIARQLALSSGNMLVTLKTTYDERFRQFAPGRLLDYEMLRYEFERGRFRTVELCTRADDMQLRWATSSREIVHVSLFRSLRARRAFELLRGIARRIPGRRAGGGAPDLGTPRPARARSGDAA